MWSEFLFFFSSWSLEAPPARSRPVRTMSRAWIQSAKYEHLFTRRTTLLLRHTSTYMIGTMDSITCMHDPYLHTNPPMYMEPVLPSV
ncbi:hypothetical protein DM02DRAFT_408074 [Periconia macrospinosa]|uniref:Secreted protein n=1 Tax=Periconia macrospinosa TaxID=97972 RepID=A0A2V1E8C9_9PLEO|nr:hypothetical protein DM02DRAFT_408074 [Periconia macrospinosa]